jgi:beta-galactosidase
MNPVIRSLFLVAVFAASAFATNDTVQPPPRERLLMDAGWRFAIGHPYDKARDFYHETGKFSYVTKAGYADGPAAAAFEDRGWRRLDLPHD